MSANCHHQGDCTVFKGYFQVDKPLDKETAEIIDALKTGRCVARDVNKLSAILEMSVKDCQRYLLPQTARVISIQTLT